MCIIEKTIDGVKVQIELSSGIVKCAFVGIPSSSEKVSSFFNRRWCYKNRPSKYNSEFTKTDIVKAIIDIVKTHFILRLSSFEAFKKWACSTKAFGSIHLSILPRIAALFKIRPLLPWNCECLEISALITRWMRLAGYPAFLVIGVRTTPFEMHAWCESNGEVVTDVRDIKNFYSVLCKFPHDL